jgi:hypothetical protein
MMQQLQPCRAVVSGVLLVLGVIAALGTLLYYRLTAGACLHLLLGVSEL